MHKIIEETVNSNVTSSKGGVENETMYYMQQIQMLEAGKALGMLRLCLLFFASVASESLSISVSSKMLDLEKQVAELQRLNEATVREKDRVLEKSVNIAREHASVRSLYDEEVSQRNAREARIAELKERVQDLETELNQRFPVF